MIDATEAVLEAIKLHVVGKAKRLVVIGNRADCAVLKKGT